MKSKNSPWYAEGDPWFLTQSDWVADKSIYFETIFTQSNGYMGVRGYTEEANPGVKSFREGYLAGVFGQIDDAALKQVRVGLWLAHGGHDNAARTVCLRDHIGRGILQPF